MDDTKTIIILHQNEAHSEVSTKKFLQMHKPGGDLELILKAIADAGIPVVWSAQGIDYDLMSEINPDNLAAMKDNRNITPLKGLYTHALISRNQYYIDLFLREGKNSLERHKITAPNIGMLPEFDMYPSAISILDNAQWDYILLQEGVNGYYDFREGISKYEQVSTAPLGILRDDLRKSMRAIITQGPRLRRDYLKMLRGLVKPQNMIDNIIAETELAHKANSPIMAFLIDLEAVQINDAMPFFEAYIAELAEAHHAGRIQLAGFNDEVCQSLEVRFGEGVPEIKLAVRDKNPKWLYGTDDYSIADKLHRNIHVLSDYHKKALLWACISDYYSAQAKKEAGGFIAKLPAVRGDNVVPDAVEIRTDRKRIDEVKHVLLAIEAGRPVYEPSGEVSEGNEPNKIILNSDSLDRMKYLDIVFKLKDPE